MINTRLQTEFEIAVLHTFCFRYCMAIWRCLGVNHGAWALEELVRSSLGFGHLHVDLLLGLGSS